LTEATSLFDSHEKAIAIAVAIIAQLVFVLVMQAPTPALVRADISDERAQPIAVAITPVPLLKLGSKTPSKLPSKWQRQKPVAAKTNDAPLPSPQATQTPEAIPTRPAPTTSVAPAAEPDAGKTTPDVTAPVDAGPVAAASGSGSPEGAKNGTETDPLKARAIGMYRAQLAGWFLSRFNIRGKIPFEKLKTLHATAVVQVTPDRKVGGFTIVGPSGDPLFDGEVSITLRGTQSSGAVLPPPPPLYPDILGQTLPVSFQCTIRSQCE
jgi:hypothetical protein